MAYCLQILDTFHTYSIETLSSAIWRKKKQHDCWLILLESIFILIIMFLSKNQTLLYDSIMCSYQQTTDWSASKVVNMTSEM